MIASGSIASGSIASGSIASVGLVLGSPECRERVEAAQRDAPRAIIGRLGDVSDGALALLGARGLTHVLVEIGGPTETAHAFVCPEQPPLARLLAAARAARAHGVAVILETPLTRSSSPSLADVARIAASLPALAYVVRLLQATPKPYPALPLALGHARAALDVARRAGVFPLLVDVPRCLGGAFAQVTVMQIARSSASACFACAARPSCAGVDDEARALDLPRMSADPPIPDRAVVLLRLIAAAQAEL